MGGFVVPGFFRQMKKVRWIPGNRNRKKFFGGVWRWCIPRNSITQRWQRLWRSKTDGRRIGSPNAPMSPMISSPDSILTGRDAMPGSCFWQNGKTIRPFPILRETGHLCLDGRDFHWHPCQDIVKESSQMMRSRLARWFSPAPPSPMRPSFSPPPAGGGETRAPGRGEGASRKRGPRGSGRGGLCGRRLRGRAQGG